jgi:hypothetical protein
MQKETIKCEPTFLGVTVLRGRLCNDGDNVEVDLSSIEMAGNTIAKSQRLTLSTNK